MGSKTADLVAVVMVRMGEPRLWSSFMEFIRRGGSSPDRTSPLSQGRYPLQGRAGLRPRSAVRFFGITAGIRINRSLMKPCEKARKSYHNKRLCSQAMC